jgi:hypothetical protein
VVLLQCCGRLYLGNLFKITSTKSLSQGLLFLLNVLLVRLHHLLQNGREFLGFLGFLGFTGDGRFGNRSNNANHHRLFDSHSFLGGFNRRLLCFGWCGASLLIPGTTRGTTRGSSSGSSSSVSSRSGQWVRRRWFLCLFLLSLSLSPTVGATSGGTRRPKKAASHFAGFGGARSFGSDRRSIGVLAHGGWMDGWMGG